MTNVTDCDGYFLVQGICRRLVVGRNEENIFCRIARLLPRKWTLLLVHLVLIPSISEWTPAATTRYDAPVNSYRTARSIPRAPMALFFEAVSPDRPSDLAVLGSSALGRSQIHPMRLLCHGPCSGAQTTWRRRQECGPRILLSQKACRVQLRH